MAYRILIGLLLVLLLNSCVATQVRLPSSARQVYKNESVKELLSLAAQNNILFHIPEVTTREVEKTEIDQKCRNLDEPFWAEKLSKHKMHAFQLSKRGGELWCEQKGDRVIMKGKAVFFMKGEILV